MRWIPFVIFAFLFLALQIGLGDLLEVGGVRPELLFIFMIYVAAMGPVPEALWGALVLGLLSDLTAPLPAPAEAGAGPVGGFVTVIGPHALGYSLGAAFTFQLRTMLYRQHPVSLMLMVLLSAIIAHLLTVFLISTRGLLGEWFGWWAAFQWSPTEELVDRFLMILYTTLLALPIGWVLIRLAPLFAFEIHPRFLSNR